MTNQLPAYLTNRAAGGFGIADDFLGGIGTSLPPHLSIDMNRFQLVDDAGNMRAPAMHIDVCFIASNDVESRIFFDPSKPFDPNGVNNAPPLCWSDNGEGPSRNAAMPQSPTCAACPQAIWGSQISKISGRGIPACQKSKKAAFLVPNDADNILYVFKIPPASLGNLEQYIRSLNGRMIGGRPCQINDVITRIEFQLQGVVKFTPVGVVDQDTFQRTELYYQDQNRIMDITGRNDIARDPALPLPAPPIQAMQVVQVLPQQGQVYRAPPPPSGAPTGYVPPNIPGVPLQQATQNATGAAPKRPGRPRTRKTPDEAAPATGQVTQQSSMVMTGPASNGELDIPDFLQRTAEDQGTAQAQVGPGMVGTQAPPNTNEMEAALSNAFSLPGV